MFSLENRKEKQGGRKEGRKQRLFKGIMRVTNELFDYSSACYTCSTGTI